MTCSNTIDFINGWRGFLVGLRRQWHAHQRFTLEGYRGGYLVANETQRVRLCQVTRLVREVLTRGAPVWTYGLGRTTVHPWGNNSSHWRPGHLSNFFYVRLIQAKSYAFTTRVLTPPAAAGRRGPPRLSFRWSYRRRCRALPPGVYRGGRRAGRYYVTAAVAAATADHLVRHPVTGVYTLGVRTPKLHRRWSPRGVVLAAQAGRALTPPPGSPGGRRGLSPVGVSRLFTRGVHRRHHQLQPPPPPAVTYRHQRWPVEFPGLTLGGGLTFLGTTLLNEVRLTGAPFVLVHGSDSSTAGVLYSVVWNQHTTSLTGFKWLMTQVWQTTVYTGVFRMVWQRLAER